MRTDKYKNYKRCKPYQYSKVHNQAKKNGHSQNGSVQADVDGLRMLCEAQEHAGAHAAASVRFD